MVQRTTIETHRGKLAEDDRLILDFSQDHDEKAFRRLVEKYKDRVHRYILGFVRDDNVADDVTQEVFLKLFLKHELYQPGTHFRAWLFEVARNQALSALRRNRRIPKPISALNVNEVERDPFENRIVEAFDAPHLIEEEFKNLFLRAVEALPEIYREVFVYCVMQGNTYEQTSQYLEIPKGTVAIRLMRARKRLFKALSPHIGRVRRPPACFR
jgi:RNA polymerase sigma-70 factor (ECF subfamily)